MIPLEAVDHDTFAPLTGHTFTGKNGSDPINLLLESVRKLGHRRPDALRDPFSLIFRGPPNLRLAQGIYALACKELGEIEIFITQVADGPGGSEFEAVFT